MRFSMPLILAGLSGLCGIALMAAGTHALGERANLAGTMLMLHAPAFLALSSVSMPPFIRKTILAGWGIGLVLFCGDMVLRATFARALFPMAAPIGGGLLMLGWGLLAITGFTRTGRRG